MKKRVWYKRLDFWKRFILTVTSLSVMLFFLGLIVLGSQSSSNDIAFGFIAVLTALFAFGQWVFPMPKPYSDLDNQSSSKDPLNTLPVSIVKQEEVEQNIHVQNQMVPITPSPLPESPGHIKEMIGLLVDQYRFSDSLDDLNKVIDYVEVLIQILPFSHERIYFKNELRKYYLERYARSNSPDDRKRAIVLYKDVIEET